MLRGTIETVNKKPRKGIPKNKLKPLILPIPDVFLNKLKLKLSNTQCKESTQEKYNEFEKALTNLGKDLSNATKSRNIEKIGHEADKLIQDRKEMFKDRKQNKKCIELISKQINKSIRQHKINVRTCIIKNEIERTGGIKKALKQLRDHTTWIPELKKKDHSGRESATSQRPQISDIATCFYRDLYSCAEPRVSPSLTATNNNSRQYLEEEIPPILSSEVRKAILSHKNGKAAGEDNITNELLKGSIDILLTPLTYLFNDIVQKEEIPAQWKTSTIILLYKKGDKNKIDNYRPISIMSNMYKTFAKVILNRLTKCLDDEQPREQAGFRSDFSTIDHIHSLKQVIEKYNEFGKYYYIAYVDYNKAFDSLFHKSIFKALTNQGVHKKYIRLVQQIYSGNTAKVQLETRGQEFKVEKGVRQGDPLSPKLFASVMEDVFRNLNWDNYGVNIDGKKLTHLRFADDIVLFAENAETLQTMLLQLTEESEKVGLTMNNSKTKTMTNSSKTNIMLRNTTIEYVDEYVYLGQIISPTLQMAKEIEKRVSSSWARYWSLKEIMKNKLIPIADKSRVYNACILPVLTYGCQSWALTKANTQRLKVCQQGMERSMLNVKLKDRKKLTDLRKISKVYDVTAKIRKLKWRWTGHMMRSTKNKWTYDTTVWYPRVGKRSRGRPVKRWEDDLPKGWRRMSLDRSQWHIMEEAYVRGQPD